MALKHIFTTGVLFVFLASIGVAHGQVDVPGPAFRPKPIETYDNTRPLAAPGIFDYDTRMFAPLEFTNGKELEPQSGFYFTLDKTYTSVSRADHQATNSTAVQTGSDYIWGTRYELGWLSEADEGWALSYQNSDGSYFTSGQDPLVSNPMLVDTGVANVEVNRIFRQMLSQGGYFEPYIGVRYFNVNDQTIEDTTQLAVAGVPVSNRFKQEANNNSFGLQVGGRYNQRRGRFRVSVDGALATNYNQQRYFATDISTDGTTVAVAETYDSDQSFVPILDGQLEIAYNISRDISIRSGIQAFYAWNGIARANTLTTSLNGNSQFGAGSGVGISNDDSTFLGAGFIFGVEWRR
ncbi:MAG: hypothetical protein AAF939_01910 [Planctomycetota bacterium]